MAPLIATTSAGAATAPGWRVNANVRNAGYSDQLGGVTADAPDDAWAVGSSQVDNQATYQPLVSHWNGTSWQQVSLPASVLATIGTTGGRTDVGATSPGNVWAIGWGEHWLHYDGQQWTAGEFAPPAPGSYPNLSRVLVLGLDNVWAFGGYYTSQGALVPYGEHFDGQSWSEFTLPGAYFVTSVSAVGPKNIWAVLSGNGSSEVANWDGTSWSTVSLPSSLTGSVNLKSVLAKSATDVWVGGADESTGDGVVGHWDGTAWTEQTFPAVSGFGTDDILQLVRDGHGGLWGLASCDIGPCWRFWHYTGGQWQGPVLPSIKGDPVSVAALAKVSGQASVWAVGSRNVGSSPENEGMILVDGRVPR